MGGQLNKRFLPLDCISNCNSIDIIIEALGEMPSGMYQVFVMWYVDGMSIAEIAFARQKDKARISSVIAEGQLRIKTKLEKSMKNERGKRAKGTGCEGRAGKSVADIESRRPIVAVALEKFINRTFDETSVSNLVSASIKKAKDENTAPLTPEKQARSARKDSTGRASFRDFSAAKPTRSGFASKFAPAAAIAAAGVLALRESFVFKVAAMTVAGSLAVGGGLIIYQSLSDARNDATMEGGAPQVSDNISVSAADAQPYDIKSNTASTAGSEHYTSVGDVLCETDGVDHLDALNHQAKSPILSIPSTLPKNPEGADRTPCAYYDAVARGRIVMVDDYSPVGHVNPMSARMVGVDTSQGEITWRIITAGEIDDVIYEDTGEEVIEPLKLLYAVQGDGVYYIEFTYTVTGGPSVTFARPIIIDTGSVSPGEYG